MFSIPTPDGIDSQRTSYDVTPLLFSPTLIRSVWSTFPYICTGDERRASCHSHVTYRELADSGEAVAEILAEEGRALQKSSDSQKPLHDDSDSVDDGDACAWLVVGHEIAPIQPK